MSIAGDPVRIKTGEGASGMRGGGSVLKAPQRRRGGTPPRSETAKLRKNPYLCILMHEKPRVFSPHGEEDTGS